MLENIAVSAWPSRNDSVTESTPCLGLRRTKPWEQWLTAVYAAKRRIMEIVLLNCRLSDTTLVSKIRKPFDVLAEGLSVSSSRGDRTSIELFLAGIASWNATTCAMLRQ